jgi:hypothetical protein
MVRALNERSAAMAEETERTSTDHRKGASERLARWDKAVEIIWSMWVVAMCIGLFIYVDREIGASPAEHHTDVTLLAAGQIIFAVIGLFALIFAMITRDRGRTLSWWVLPCAGVFCVCLIAVGYDGWARLAPQGMLPTLEQIAPEPVSVAHVVLSVAVPLILLEI